MDWNRSGLDWTGLGRAGLDWGELGSDWTRLCSALGFARISNGMADLPHRAGLPGSSDLAGRPGRQGGKLAGRAASWQAGQAGRIKGRKGNPGMKKPAKVALGGCIGSNWTNWQERGSPRS